MGYESAPRCGSVPESHRNTTLPTSDSTCSQHPAASLLLAVAASLYWRRVMVTSSLEPSTAAARHANTLGNLWTLSAPVPSGERCVALDGSTGADSKTSPAIPAGRGTPRVELGLMSRAHDHVPRRRAMSANCSSAEELREVREYVHACTNCRGGVVRTSRTGGRQMPGRRLPRPPVVHLTRALLAARPGCVGRASTPSGPGLRCRSRSSRQGSWSRG